MTKFIIDNLTTTFIIAHYTIAIASFVYQGDYARAYYWFAALQITVTAMYFIR
jgi:hypothetical protein